MAKEFPPRQQARAVSFRSDMDLMSSSHYCDLTNSHKHTSQWAEEAKYRTLKCPILHSAGSDSDCRYPKHVWSPAGGWYAQPANWKANTAVMGLVLGSIVAAAWTLSANREYRDKMPEPHRFFPSRYWSRQIVEHERKQKEQGAVERTIEG
ncbi:Nn.00g031900.m01.CDS01 [Neocucurbitaria sp. VM-36]